MHKNKLKDPGQTATNYRTINACSMFGINDLQYGQKLELTTVDKINLIASVNIGNKQKNTFRLYFGPKDNGHNLPKEYELLFIPNIKKIPTKSDALF